MIKKLNHQSLKEAEKIYQVFQASYAIEAKILKAVDFPPLKRTVSDLKKSETQFFGYLKDHNLAAVIEIDQMNQSVHIQSLVVDPKYFRLGIAKALMEFVLNNFITKKMTVETGLDNFPAVNLYKKMGFHETKQYDTNHGIRKIRLEKY
ncbi:MAG: GNAT family N-acetyltransferase [Marinicellaceae bacterium]